MKTVPFFFVLFASIVAFGKDPMCVRNYAKQGGGFLCTDQPKFYTLVPHLTEKDTAVCTRIYDDFYCRNTRGYEFITSTKGERFCTVNYNQPPISNFCDSVPQYYDYISKAATE